MSALMRAVAASGGQVFDGLAPVPTSIPVFSGQTAITSTAESQTGGSNSHQVSSRSAGSTSLLVAPHGEVEKTTDQALRALLHGVGSAESYGAKLIVSKTPAIWAGFDDEHLSPIVAGATSVEWDAAAPVATLSSALATYDDTAYNADAMIVTRRGKRTMGLATDGDGRLQWNGVTSIPFDGPVFETDVTGTDLGSATLLALIGPWANCAVGNAGETELKLFDQLEPTAGGAQENIISAQVQRYAGFARPAVGTLPLTAWTRIIDAV